MKYPNLSDLEAFDPNDPFDARANHASKFLVQTYLDLHVVNPVLTGEDLQATAGGLLVGLLGIVLSHAAPDEHEKIVEGVVQLVPWAAQQARGAMGLPPIEPNP